MNYESIAEAIEAMKVKGKGAASVQLDDETSTAIVDAIVKLTGQKPVHFRARFMPTPHEPASFN